MTSFPFWFGIFIASLGVLMVLFPGVSERGIRDAQNDSREMFRRVRYNVPELDADSIRLINITMSALLIVIGVIASVGSLLQA